MKHHPHDADFIAAIRARLPVGIQGQLESTYSFLYDTQGRQAANHYWLTVKDPLEGKSLLVHSDADLKAKAQRLAQYAEGMSHIDQAAAYVGSQGLALPNAATEAGLLARIACPLWWESALRRKQDKEHEQLYIQWGMIRQGVQAYCSTELLKRLLARQQRALDALSHYDAVSDEGEVLPLREVLKGSMANPAVRRAELMVRLRGFEDYAAQHGHTAQFYTLTCPSKYHRYSGAQLNPKYADYTPKQGQDYLVSVWACIRAKLKREGLPVYGFRVAEPHADGTPHWHILLFMKPAHLDTVTAILRDYALKEDGDEAGAAQHRFEAVTIDPRQGSATGYLAKYISKNVDGFGLAQDEASGLAATEAAQRVRAWSSVWGIRQFQQIGGALVGVWRELRRLEPTEHALSDTLPDRELLEQARIAADASDWCAYLTLQGGAEVNRKAQPIRVYTLEMLDPETGERLMNRYGEPKTRVKGLALHDVPAVATRTKVWTLQPQPKGDESEIQSEAKPLTLARLQPAIRFDLLASVLATLDDGDEADVLQAAGRALLPWSTVNNCTLSTRQPTGTERRAAR